MVAVREFPAHARPLVIGHRGHSSGAPEQTLAAFSEAARLGADMVEADVRRTSDGHFVLLHDATLDRTTTGRGEVSAQTLGEVRALDAGRWFSARSAGERVPTLLELFELADTTGLRLCLEIKGATAGERLDAALQLALVMRRRNCLERDVLASFDHPALAAARAAVPGLRVAPDRLPERGASRPAELLAQALSCGATVVQHHHADLTADSVEALHDAGLEIWAWPPTTPAEVDAVLDLGVDGVMGDDVAVAVERIGRRW